MDKLYIMEQNKFDGSYMLFDSEFARSFIALMGLGEDRIIWVNPLCRHIFYIKELHCVESVYGMTAESAWALKGLSENIISRMQIDFEAYPKRIYVKRIGRRKLLGVESLLAKYQFCTIIPEELSLEEQIKYFHAADIVLSPHGANSTNCLYMRKGTHFIETCGKKYIQASWLRHLEIRGIHYHMIVEFGKGSSNPDIEDHADYTVDLGLLELILQDTCRIGYYSLLD